MPLKRRRLLILGSGAILAGVVAAVMRRALHLPLLPALLRPRKPLPVGECTWYAWGRAREAVWAMIWSGR